MLKNICRLDNIFVAIALILITLFLVVMSSTFVKDVRSLSKVFAYTESETIQIQQSLKELGYFDEEVTGYYGNITRQAVKDFQYDYGLSVTGEVDGATASALGIHLGSQQSNDLYILAKCIYAEARGEVYEGQVAVGAVVLNRVASPDFPNTIYGVVYQPWAFTSVSDGQMNLEPNGSAYQAAQDAINGWDPTYGCLYYYNPAVATSSWIFDRTTVVTIGNHVFAI
ncbi:MAG: spore cortex-lytic enzyme [Clostridiales bacterium]|nr:spore cortex-lytic enzyme [Clostridiales bacterium]